MAKLTIEERLAALDAKRKALQARLGKQERARDTRRKVLLGAFLMHQLESGKDAQKVAMLREWLKSDLDAFLVRPTDKELLADLVSGTPENKEPANG